MMNAVRRLHSVMGSILVLLLLADAGLLYVIQNFLDQGDRAAANVGWLWFAVGVLATLRLAWWWMILGAVRSLVRCVTPKCRGQPQT